LKPLGTVYLLDRDPELLELVADRERAAARRALSASAYRVKAGSWHPDALLVEGERPHFGVLVLEGLLLRDVVVAHTTCGELVGPGELLRPWDDFGERAPMPLEIEWKALQMLEIAVLDHEFARVLATWPTVLHAFIDRAIARSHSLALHVAIHCIRRVDVSLLVLFSHLADRFGKVTPAGITIPIRLTQQDLGKLVGATRQSISAALAQLAQSRALARRADGSWLLNPGMPEELEQMLTRRRRAHLPEGSVR
jgi:CRP/FNR family cyclic AMP-dependent transcriptional regulator